MHAVVNLNQCELGGVVLIAVLKLRVAKANLSRRLAVYS